MVIIFIKKLVLMEKKEPPKVIFQLGVMHNLPANLSKYCWMNNNFCLVCRLVQTHLNAKKWHPWHFRVKVEFSIQVLLASKTFLDISRGMQKKMRKNFSYKISSVAIYVLRSCILGFVHSSRCMFLKPLQQKIDIYVATTSKHLQNLTFHLIIHKLFKV
jgi:hypothetical protein